MPPSIKKLVAGFLVSASLIASAALVLPSLLPAAPAPAALSGGVAAQVPPVGKNAFVESVPQSEPGQNTASGGGVNLSKLLADNVAQTILQKNQGGPAQIGGQVGLVSPTPAELDAAVAQGLAAAKTAHVALPNFDETVAASSLNVIENPSPADFQNYFAAVNRALAATVAGKDYQTVVAADPSTASAQAGKSILETAVADVEAVPVPSSLVPLDQKILRLLLNRKKFVDVALAQGDDPLRSLAVAQDTETKIDSVMGRDGAAVAAELDLLSTHPPAVGFAKTPSFAEAVANLLGIPRAEAQSPVFVPVDATGPNSTIFHSAETQATTGSWLHLIFEWTAKILLQNLKAYLINMLELQVINWINGGGTPQFVTNWKSFLSDAFNNAAGDAIAQVLPGLCYPGVISAALYFSYNVPVLVPQCTLTQVVDNIKNFYSDLRNGGWLAYSVNIQENDVFTNLYLADRAVYDKAAAAQLAAQNEALAGQGFLGVQTCVPDLTQPYGEKCKNYQIATPGSILAGQVNKALGSNFDFIVNAQDVAGLVSTITNAALSRLIRLGMQAIASGGSQGGGFQSITYAAAPPLNATGAGNVAAICQGLSGQDLSACRTRAANAQGFANQGVAPPPSGSVPGTGNLTDKANQYLKDLQAASTADNQWIQAAGSVLTGLSQITRCSAGVMRNLAYLQPSDPYLSPFVSEINGAMPVVQADLQSVNTSIAAVTSLRDKLTNVSPTDYAAITDLTSQLNALTPGDMKTDQASVALRNARLNAVTNFNAKLGALPNPPACAALQSLPAIQASQ